MRVWLRDYSDSGSKTSHHLGLHFLPYDIGNRVSVVLESLGLIGELSGVYYQMAEAITQKQHLLSYLKTQAPARARELEDIGISAATISRAVASGEIIRIGRGLYTLQGREPDTHESLIEVTKRAPKAVICLTSALAFHGLTDQIPRKIWIAIGAKDWQPRIDYPRIRVVRFREPYFSSGIQEHHLNGHSVRIYSISKSLADAFRNQRLVDRSVAIESLKSAIGQHKATPAEIAEAARKFAAWKQMQPYLEAITSNG